jgi:hypothetical protein
MSVFELYSKWKKAMERSGQPDVYQYDSIPGHVSNQIIMIWNDAIGFNEAYWGSIIETLGRNMVIPQLGRLQAVAIHAQTFLGHKQML